MDFGISKSLFFFLHELNLIVWMQNGMIVYVCWIKKNKVEKIKIDCDYIEGKTNLRLKFDGGSFGAAYWPGLLNDVMVNRTMKLDQGLESNIGWNYFSVPRNIQNTHLDLNSIHKLFRISNFHQDYLTPTMMLALEIIQMHKCSIEYYSIEDI